MRQLTRTAVATVASAAALVGTVAVAAPAQAASTRECYTNNRSISLPNKPDVDVRMTLCVQRDGGLVQAQAYLSWAGNYGWIGGDRFNSFSVQLRLERYDDVKKSTSYSQLWGLNNQYSNSTSNNIYLTDRPAGGWSADGVITYDVAGDGLGATTWNLHGSPVIS